jgi:hypothetical protein
MAVTLPFVEIRFHSFPSNQVQWEAREYVPEDG